MNTLILFTYFIGFKLSNNLIPSSYLIEFALGKKVLWGVNWNYSYEMNTGSLRVDKNTSCQKIEGMAQHFKLSLPVKLLIKKIKFLKKLETNLLIKFSPYYSLQLHKQETKTTRPSSDTFKRIMTLKYWSTGIHVGFSWDFPVNYKGFPFKIRLNTNFANLYYREDILESKQIFESDEKSSRIIMKHANFYFENPLKNELSIYLIFEL